MTWSCCEFESRVLKQLTEPSLIPFSFFYSITSNLRAVVYSIGVREGGVREWNQVYDKYKSTNIASEKEILLSALSYTLVPEMIER